MIVSTKLFSIQKLNDTLKPIVEIGLILFKVLQCTKNEKLILLSSCYAFSTSLFIEISMLLYEISKTKILIGSIPTSKCGTALRSAICHLVPTHTFILTVPTSNRIQSNYIVFQLLATQVFFRRRVFMILLLQEFHFRKQLRLRRPILNVCAV